MNVTALANIQEALSPDTVGRLALHSMSIKASTSKKMTMSDENGVCRRPSCPVSALCIQAYCVFWWILHTYNGTLRTVLLLVTLGALYSFINCLGEKWLGNNPRPHKVSTEDAGTRVIIMDRRKYVQGMGDIH